MEHVEAHESHAVERYLLNEMTEDERDVFENHTFDCSACAEDLMDGARLMDSGRAVALETAKVVSIESRRRTLTTWAPLAAAAILVIALSPILIPRRSAPSIYVLDAPQLLAAGESRSTQTVTKLRAGQRNLLVVDVPQEPAFPRYEIVIRDAAGKTRITQPASAEQTKESLNLLLDPLPSGSYVLAIDGVHDDGKRTAVDSHRVQVQ